jgi:hypothetical protein
MKRTHDIATLTDVGDLSLPLPEEVVGQFAATLALSLDPEWRNLGLTLALELKNKTVYYTFRSLVFAHLDAIYGKVQQAYFAWNGEANFPSDVSPTSDRSFAVLLRRGLIDSRLIVFWSATRFGHLKFDETLLLTGNNYLVVKLSIGILEKEEILSWTDYPFSVRNFNPFFVFSALIGKSSACHTERWNKYLEYTIIHVPTEALIFLERFHHMHYQDKRCDALIQLIHNEISSRFALRVVGGADPMAVGACLRRQKLLVLPGTWRGLHELDSSLFRL